MSVPMWSLLIAVVFFFLGRFWQWEKDFQDLKAIYQVVADLSARLLLAGEVDPVCAHGFSSDDCPICQN